MWHEARKQERKIRGMMVDYKKRAERRREYYEKIKADPTQFLQLHGRRCKVHLDPAVAQAADSPANMMPWQGHADTLIDRFDGRAHLDHITEYKGSTDVERPTEDSFWEERQASYERYRILVENDFIGISEEKFLMQIYLEEQFGPIIRVGEEDKKKSSDKKAAIGYVYEDSTPLPPPPPKADDDESKKDSDSDIDLDVTVDVDLLTFEQSKEMNEHSLKYGMVGEDFICMMTRDKEEAESLRLAKEAEEEKAMYSGRKSRRERRAFREKKLQGRKISPPSYAARESPTYDPYTKEKSPSRSRSRSPVDAGKITYITSFGGDISDESGNERRNLPRPSFVSSMTSVIGPALPTVKPLAASKDKLSGKPNAAAGTTLMSSRLRSDENKSSITSAPSSTITSSASTKRSRSNSVSSLRSNSISSSSSSSRSRSRTRERLNRRNRNGPNRRSSYYSRSHSRSPLESRHRRNRRGRRRRSVGRGRSRSSSSSLNSLSRSRSRSRSLSQSSSRSRSRSRSSSPRRYSRGKSHSKSPNGRSPTASTTSSTNMGAGSASTSTGVVSRYYGRRREQKSDSSNVSMDSDGDDEDQEQGERQSTSKGHSHTNFRGQNVGGKAVYGTKVQKLTPQERLKRRMQAALNKQYKADKRAEMKKLEKQEQERQDREEELRELAIKLRRRERERRHRRQDSGGGERSPSDSKRGRSRSYSSSDSNSDSSDSLSSSRSNSPSPSAEPSAPSHSDSSSDSSAKGRATKRKSQRRSRSPLVHY